MQSYSYSVHPNFHPSYFPSCVILNISLSLIHSLCVDFMKSRKALSVAASISFLFLILILSSPSHAFIRTVEGTVSKITDGDTLQVITQEGTKLKIRLYGCDAPETEKRNRATEDTSIPGQPYAEEAMQALKAKVYRKKVRVDIIDIDRYRRMVSMIWLGNRNINLEMVREGYAEAYREYLKEPYRSQFIDVERKARSERNGIWGLSNYERPCDFRKRMRVRGN